MSFHDGEFTTQYAIRMPSGEFWRPPCGHIGAEQEHPPAIFDTEESAQYVLDRLRFEAARLGVHHWYGVIEKRICSPFTTSEPGERLVADLQEWLRRQ